MKTVSARLTRLQRLSGPRGFDLVFAKGARASDPFFIVIASPGGLDCARLGIAVSRRAIRYACDRNRIKRIVRESFRQHAETLGAFDLVVQVRSRAGEASNRQLFDSLAVFWRSFGRRND